MNDERIRHFGIFIGFTFGIPLVCSLLMMTGTIFQSGMLNLILYAIEGASPFIAVVLLFYIKGRSAGVKKYFIQKYKLNFSLSICIIAFLIPALVMTIAKVLMNRITGNSYFITLPSSKKMLIILWALIAEELGWRGYLQDVVEERFGMYVTPLIVGIIWTLWHYHFFLTGSMNIALGVFAYGCIAESYGYYVITKMSKGNIIPATLWHFSGNLFSNLYLLTAQCNNGSMIPYVMTNVIFSVIDIGIVIYWRQKKTHIIC